MKFLKLLESIDGIRILDYEDYIKEYDIQDVLDFCTKMFPKSYFSREHKLSIYESDGAIILIAMDGDDVVGICESYISNGIRLLANAAVAETHRKQGIFKKMWDITINRIPESKIVVHFRDSNKGQLHFYESLGFSNLQNVGNYMNGEIKWEMDLVK